MLAMDEGTKRWILRTAQSNFWRVASHYDLADLIQDGYLHYYRVVNKYPHIESRRHIMGLFQRTYTNHIHNLAKDRTRMPDHLVTAGLDDDPADVLERLMGDRNVTAGDMSLVEILESAPAPVRAVLELLLHKPEALRAPYRVRANGARETLNERICRRLGVPYEFDLVTPTRQYLAGMSL